MICRTTSIDRRRAERMVPEESGIPGPGFAAWLIAGVACGAVYVRVNAGVVERAGDDRHRDRTCPATAHGPIEIAALPGGDAADDEPDGKNHGSKVHLDLLSILCVIYGEAVNRDCRPLLWSGTPKEAYPRAAIWSPLRASPMPFPGIWKFSWQKTIGECGSRRV